ncbi:MAG TPA: SAM-dependent chlorinase/fluorinase [Tepidisphaeraceae bacterium]|nr:SAM-dependent chlorinase/fluorinase [Tepidisphaeraceae bacterium]
MLRRRSRRATSASRPIITLLSDFGLADSYVAAMKAVLIRHCPDARLIDVTHQVPRHDVLCGSITLERAVDGFPPRTVHLAVIDPGVGSDRRLLIAEVNDQFIVCPDNGLVTWPWRMHVGGAAHQLTWRPTRVPSHTFHGRDILAPTAAQIASGVPIAELGRPIADPVLLDIAPAEQPATRGRVIHLDHFGNATTNIPVEVLGPKPQAMVHVNRKTIGKLKKTYWDVAPGKPLALIGSSGLLEIAVRDGSAKDDLKVRVGDEVQLR